MRHDSLSDALVTIKNADHVGKDSANQATLHPRVFVHKRWHNKDDQAPLMTTQVSAVCQTRNRQN